MALALPEFGKLCSKSFRPISLLVKDDWQMSTGCGHLHRVMMNVTDIK